MSIKPKVRSKKGAPKNKPAEPPGMRGPGVEVLEIPEIEKAMDEVVRVKEEIAGLKEILESAELRLTEAMETNRARLIRDETGGISYRFGNRLVSMALKKQKVHVKIIRDAAQAGPDDED
jgi:hypothetical protein